MPISVVCAPACGLELIFKHHVCSDAKTKYMCTIHRDNWLLIGFTLTNVKNLVAKLWTVPQQETLKVPIRIIIPHFGKGFLLSDTVYIFP